MGDTESLFQNVFSSLTDGVLLISENMVILKGNQAVEEMFLRSLDSFEGRPLTELFPDQPELMEKMQQTIATESSYRDVECMGFRKSTATSFPVNMTLSPSLDEEGKVQAVAMLIKDMSLLKDLQETSRQVDHMPTLGALALGMAHEIRNPLGGIRGSAQLLLQELQDEEQKEYL